MNRNRLLNKYLLLALILTALFAMTGCRTRITNNSEVSNVYYDEDGFLSETYQMRRDELGLSTAESPIFPDLGSGDTEDDFDSSEEPGLNYEPEEDTYVEPPTTSTTTSTPSTTHRYSTPGRRHTSPSNSNTTTTYKVTLDPGEGKFEGKSKGDKLSLYIQKNKPFNLPSGNNDVTRAGYKLTEWKDGSTTHKPGAKVTVTKDVTYTAVWEKGSNKKKEEKPPKENKKEFTVKFKDGKKTLKEEKVGKGKAATPPSVGEKSGYSHKWDTEDYKRVTKDLTVNLIWTKNPEKAVATFYNSEGKKIGTLEVVDGKISGNIDPPEKEGYDFSKWDPDPSSIKENTDIHPIWTLNPEAFWNSAIDGNTDTVNYYCINGSNGKSSIVETCNGEFNEESPDKVVGFADSKTDAEDIKNSIKDKYAGIKEDDIIIVKNPPSDSAQELQYKLYLYEALHGKSLKAGKSDVEDVAAETKKSKADIFTP